MKSLVAQFQKDVAEKLSIYFKKNLNTLNNKEPKIFNELIKEYDKLFKIVENKWDYKSLELYNIKNKSEVLLQCISEAETKYNLGEIYGGPSNLIYSPRADLAITPIIKVKNGKNKPLGIYRLPDDIKIFKLLHQLDFIKTFENKLFQMSKGNYYQIGIELERMQYINKKPLHLFSIEIENGINIKNLMGDFLNAISISKIPIVIVPKDKLDKTLNMLLYSKTIYEIKGVNIFNILNKTIVLTVEQFREVINSELDKMNISNLKVIDYR